MNWMMTGSCRGHGDGYDWTEWGSRDRRTKAAYPYSYSEHFVWRDESHDALKTASAEYHDRMQEWDYDKWKAAMEGMPNRHFRDWPREKISEFLTAYHGRPIKAVALSEGCNVSNGYPYWVFWFRDAEKKTSKRRARLKSPKGDTATAEDKSVSLTPNNSPESSE